MIGARRQAKARDFIGQMMLVLEVLGQNLFEPASIDDLVIVTGLERSLVSLIMKTLCDLGYVRETEIGYQQSDMKVRKFDWRSRVYDDYIRDSYGKTVPFRGPDGEWYQRV